MAVGRDFTAGIFVTVFGALALVFGSIGIAVAITVVTLIKRSKKKKLLVQTAGSHGVAPAREADKRW
jgi:tryptophan synthase beta subunit